MISPLDLRPTRPRFTDLKKMTEKHGYYSSLQLHKGAPVKNIEYDGNSRDCELCGGSQKHFGGYGPLVLYAIPQYTTSKTVSHDGYEIVTREIHTQTGWKFAIGFYKYEVPELHVMIRCVNEECAKIFAFYLQRQQPEVTNSNLLYPQEFLIFLAVFQEDEGE